MSLKECFEVYEKFYTPGFNEGWLYWNETTGDFDLIMVEYERNVTRFEFGVDGWHLLERLTHRFASYREFESIVTGELEDLKIAIEDYRSRR